MAEINWNHTLFESLLLQDGPGAAVRQPRGNVLKIWVTQENVQFRRKSWFLSLKSPTNGNDLLRWDPRVVRVRIGHALTTGSSVERVSASSLPLLELLSSSLLDDTRARLSSASAC